MAVDAWVPMVLPFGNNFLHFLFFKILPNPRGCFLLISTPGPRKENKAQKQTPKSSFPHSRQTLIIVEPNHKAGAGRTTLPDVIKYNTETMLRLDFKH